MSMFKAAMKMCDDCSRNDRPLSWSRDGHTKICEACQEARGDREKGPRSALSHDSEELERKLLES